MGGRREGKKIVYMNKALHLNTCTILHALTGSILLILAQFPTHSQEAFCSPPPLSEAGHQWPGATEGEQRF